MASEWRLPLVIALSLASTGFAAQLPDPMRPPPAHTQQAVAEMPSDATLTLNSTLIARGRRVAIINGAPYTTGDTVDGRRLVEIGPTAVVLERAGERLRIELLPSAIRKPAGG